MIKISPDELREAIKYIRELSDFARQRLGGFPGPKEQELVDFSHSFANHLERNNHCALNGHDWNDDMVVSRDTSPDRSIDCLKVRLSCRRCKGQQMLMFDLDSQGKGQQVLTFGRDSRGKCSMGADLLRLLCNPTEEARQYEV